jgi:hypothetical protein
VDEYLRNRDSAIRGEWRKFQAAPADYKISDMELALKEEKMVPPEFLLYYQVTFPSVDGTHRFCSCGCKFI